MRRPISNRERNTRVLVAQSAARLIAEHGIADWSSAKRKALRQLGLDERHDVPTNEEIEQALHDYHSLFGAASQPIALKRKREEALRWMMRLASFSPVLTGGVAAGWASDHSDIRIELEADDPKTVEIELLNLGIDYSIAPTVAGMNGAALQAATGIGMLRIDIVTPQKRRQRRRREKEDRLDQHALASLLQAATAEAPPAI